MFSYNWDFSFIPQYQDIILKGVITTLELSIITIIFVTVFGTVIGIMMSQFSILLKQGAVYLVDIIRSIPLLVLILFVYYLFPVIGLVRIDAFWPAVVALIINCSAFFGDIVRGSLEGLPKGLMLSALSLGFNRNDALKRIILPEVYRETFPAVTLLYIEIIKATSLVSVVAVYDITHVGQWIIASTFKPLEIYTLTAGLYLVIVFPLTFLSRRLEKSDYFKRRTV